MASTLGSAIRCASSPTLNVTGTVRSTPLADRSCTEAEYWPTARPSGLAETCISWNLPELSNFAGETDSHAAELLAVSPSSRSERDTAMDCGSGTPVPVCAVNVRPLGKALSVSVDGLKELR